MNCVIYLNLTAVIFMSVCISNKQLAEVFPIWWYRHRLSHHSTLGEGAHFNSQIAKVSRNSRDFSYFLSATSPFCFVSLYIIIWFGSPKWLNIFSHVTLVVLSRSSHFGLISPDICLHTPITLRLMEFNLCWSQFKKHFFSSTSHYGTRDSMFWGSSRVMETNFVIWVNLWESQVIQLRITAGLSPTSKHFQLQ